MYSFIISIGPSQKANTGPPRPLCQSCHLMLLPHLPGKELPKLVTPFLFVVLNPVLYIVILLYMYSVHFLNCCFSCKGSCHASPSMYTCTLRVLYIVAESLYPLYTSFQLHRMVSPQPLPPPATHFASVLYYV